MNPLYNAGISLYKAAASVAALRSEKIKEMLRGERATLQTLKQERLSKAPEGYDLWIHASSLGEFEQGRPLIERLRRERPEFKILLTFFSPSGYRVRCNYQMVDTVAYLPLDTPKAAKQFIEAANPKMAIFVKYEFWGNYLEQLAERNVPTYIISAIFRTGQIFFRKWGGMFRKMLRKFTHLYVQDEHSREMLSNIGVNNVTVAGDTRFDRVTDILNASRPLPIIEKFAENSEFTLIAGSSWGPDEDIYLPWVHENSDVKLIIAPHEFDDERLARLLKVVGNGTYLLSKIDSPENIPADCRAIIVDSFGLLSSIYRYGSVAHIGGGFGASIHNINEAAVYGMPVTFGPRHEKFKEASDLISCGGGFEVTDQASFASLMTMFKTDKNKLSSAGHAAGEYIRSNLGATDRIFADLF